MNETLSLNESGDSPDQKNKYDLLNDFMTPIEDRNKIDPTEESNSIAKLNIEILKDVFSSDYQNCESPLLYKYASRWNTERMNNKKLIESDSSFDNSNQKKQILVKKISEMKSKLPPSHLPENINNELVKQDSLVIKLQAMHVTDNFEDRKSNMTYEQLSHPQFLPIEMTGDTAEELARIDAELAWDCPNDWRNSESSLFVNQPW